MLGINSKSRVHLVLGDIQELIDLKIPEGEHIEFKETLPGKGNHRDPWLNGENNIGREAKNKILEEMVAFANAHGGVLLIGIQEADAAEPPFAAEITPLPRCAALVERFSSIFSTCVEPQIPSLEVFAVLTDGDNGVLVIRVGRSRLAPHRVTTTKECTVRRRDRCEKLTMWEIQDMTLNAARGMDRFEGRLSERSKHFQGELDKLSDPNNAYGMRFTALPVGEDIKINRVYRENALVDGFDTQWRKVKSITNNKPRWFVCPWEFHRKYWRPILRGARTELREPHAIHPPAVGYQEIHCDGLIEVGFAKCDPYFYKDLPFVLFANMLAWTNQIKTTVVMPMAEYGLEVEIYHRGRPVHRVNIHNIMTEAHIHQLRDDPEQLDSLYPLITNVKFPTYELISEEVMPANTLLAVFWKDFQHWLGKDDDNEAEFEIVEL